MRVNRGGAAAANAGIKAAKGRYIAFLDSDDEWLPECLQCHVHALADKPRAITSCCDCVLVWESFNLERLQNIFAPDKQQWETSSRHSIATLSATVTLREALLTLGFNENYRVSYEMDFGLRIALLNIVDHLVHVPRPLVRHALSTDSVTRRYKRWNRDVVHMLDRFYQDPVTKPYLEYRENHLKNITRGIFMRRLMLKWLEKELISNFLLLL